MTKGLVDEMNPLHACGERGRTTGQGIKSSSSRAWSRDFLLSAFLSGFMVLPGCGASVTYERPAEQGGPQTVSIGEPAAPILPSYVSRRDARFDDGMTATFLVLKMDPAVWRWELAEDAAHPKTAAAWREATGAEIAMNAAYFTASGTPAGYFRTSTAKSRVPWPKDDDGYTGAVAIMDGALTLAYLPSDAVDRAGADALFLTYPTLVADGKALVEKDSTLLARRTALAVDAGGTPYAIVTEKGLATLFALSRWLAAQPERFVRAVNLDGGPSTGLSLGDGSVSFDLGVTPVPNALVVRRR